MDKLTILHALLSERSTLINHIRLIEKELSGLSTDVVNKVIYKEKIGEFGTGNLAKLEKAIADFNEELFYSGTGKLRVPYDVLLHKSSDKFECMMTSEDFRDDTHPCGWRKDVFLEIYADCYLTEEGVLYKKEQLNKDKQDVETAISDIEDSVRELTKELGGGGE